MLICVNIYTAIHVEGTFFLKILKGTTTILVLLVCVVTFVVMLVNVPLHASVQHNFKFIVFNHQMHYRIVQLCGWGKYWRRIRQPTNNFLP